MSASTLFTGCTASLQSATFGVPLILPRSDREFIGWHDAREKAYWAGYCTAQAGLPPVIPTGMEGTIADCFLNGFDDGERDLDPERIAEFNREIDQMAAEAEALEQMVNGHPMW